MRTRARIEAEIAALATEVQELARGRGRSLPTLDEWADLLEVLGVTDEDLHAGAQGDEDEEAVFSRFVTRGEVTPAAESVQEAFLAVVLAAVSEDRPAYYRALRALPPLLSDLLVRRAEQWSHHWTATSHFFDLYRGARSWLTGASAPPSLSARPDRTAAEGVQANVAKAKGWQLALLAALALRCAAAELTEWRAWIAGGATTQHDSLLRERVSSTPRCSDDPGTRWARDVAKHTLPDEEEAALVQRGVVSAEELAAVRALPPIPPGRESGH